MAGRLVTTHESSSIRLRLFVCGLCLIGLVPIYIRSLASAHPFHSIRAFTYPWHDIAADIMLLALSTVCIACVLPVLRLASLTQRIVVGLCLTLPVWVLGHFIAWIIGVYEN